VIFALLITAFIGYIFTFLVNFEKLTHKNDIPNLCNTRVYIAYKLLLLFQVSITRIMLYLENAMSIHRPFISIRYAGVPTTQASHSPSLFIKDLSQSLLTSIRNLSQSEIKELVI
jgi:hypothetical protein